MQATASLNRPRHLGVHYPEKDGYEKGQLGLWLRLFGMVSAANEGIACLKVYDKRGEWLRESAPDIGAALNRLNGDFILDARALQFRLMVHGNVWFKQRPGGATTIDAETKRRLQVWARAFADYFKGAILCGPLNEPGEGAWIGSEAQLVEVQRIVGKVWTEMGREWAVVPEASLVTTLVHMPELLATLKAGGARPTHICVHAYGQGNAAARHVQDLKAGLEYVGCTLPLIFQEYHYGFPPFGMELEQRADLLTEETGGWCADFALAIQRSGDYGCLFTLDTMIPAGYGNAGTALPQSTMAFASSIREGRLLVTPRAVPNQREYAYKTYRLLAENRGYIAAALAKRAVRGITYPESMA